MESNQEQTLVEIEQAFENWKSQRMQAKFRWEAAKGKYHMELVARRESGEKMTIADMKSLESCAIDDIEDVKDAYLWFIKIDGEYRNSKVKYEDAKRRYWDGKPVR